MKSMSTSDRIGFVASLLLGTAFLAVMGCAMIQDYIGALNGAIGTNAPPSMTNMIPVITNLPPIVIDPPASEVCGCDLSLPRATEDIRVIYDRVNGEGSHKAAGNNEVCWSAQSGQGYDIRCLFRSTNPRQRHVSSWGRKWGYTVLSRGILDALCFRQTLAGVTYQFHWLGWSTEEDQRIENPNVRRVICAGRTFGFWDVYIVDGVVVTPPVVDPPVAPPDPVADIAVPPRVGANAYSGNGTGGTFFTVPNSATWNPAKAVSLEAWVFLRGWPRADEGCMIVGKGSVGRSWAYGLKIRPGVLLYQQTQGTVYANYKWRTGEWHHIRCDADKSGVRFWADGKNIPVTSSEVTSYLGANDYPVRIGGQHMDWEPSAWYNASIDGIISDWRIVVR